MRLRGESLAGIAMLDDVLGIVEGHEPVEPRPKSLGDEGLTVGVMPTGSFVNVPEEGDSILWRYAPLENSCRAALVEFPVDYREGLGVPYDLSAMDSIFREFASSQVGQVRIRQNCFDEHDFGCFLG
jgi:hypothetical protein